MSERNKRRLKFTIHGTMLIAIVALGVVSFMPPSTVTPASAQTTPVEATDPVVYSKVQKLRRELALTNGDLAAMGCTQAQAESILTALKSWYETNTAALTQADASVRTAQRNLRGAMRKHHVGPRDEALIASLPGLRSAVATAETNRKAAIDAAIPTIAGHIPSGQSTTWATARANVDRHSDLRYMPNVTDEQAADYEKALRKRRRTGDSTDAIGQRLLAVSQTSEATAARTRAQTSTDAVLAAEAEILPPPAEEEETIEP